MSKSIFIFSGEHSGDVHGGKLGIALKENKTGLALEGVTGPSMCKAEIKSFMDIEAFSVMGFSDVLCSLPKLLKNFKKIRNHLLKTKPDAVVLIDYQEFSYLLSKSLRKHGFMGKIIQLISPTVWAWRARRSDKLAKYLDLLLTIFPFEPKYFAHTPLPAKYIGNPILEKIQTHQYQHSWKEHFPIEQMNLIGIFPGSRKSEIEKNLPLFIKAANLIKKDHYLFAISCVDPSLNNRISTLITHYAINKERFLLIPREFTYELMQESCVALAKSGTVTLELAIHHTPTVVAYEISSFHKFFCKLILRINLPYYCIVNILASQEVFPEYIDHQIDPQTLASSIQDLLSNTTRREALKKHCRSIEKNLAFQSPSDAAAHEILKVIDS